MQLQLTVVPDVFCKLPAEGHPDLMYYQCGSVTKTIRTPWSFLEYVYFACEYNSCEPYQQKPLQQIKKGNNCRTGKNCPHKRKLPVSVHKEVTIRQLQQYDRLFPMFSCPVSAAHNGTVCYGYFQSLRLFRYSLHIR